jgi:hypothetical protein
MAKNPLRYDGRRRPVLTAAQILSWADAHRGRTGAWPLATSGALAAAPGETWAALNMALRLGLRGLPGGSSLARLLRQERGVPERRGGRPDQTRRREAARLRRRGLSLAEIGARLGVTRQRVASMLRQAADAGGRQTGQAS